MFIRSYEVHLQSKLGHPTLFHPRTDIIFFFIFLRHYLVDVLMGAIFGIPKSTANKIRHRVLDFMYDLLSPQLIFTPYEERLSSAKSLFHQVLYTWVVDGTEQPICATFHPGVNTQLYSTKKKQHSITILLFVTMSGRIFFLSSSYGGGTNDLEMAIQEIDKWNQFRPDETGMGDAGFQGNNWNHKKSHFIDD